MKYKNGEEFLNSLYSNMHMEEEVMHKALKSDSPDEKIRKYLDRLENAHDMAFTSPHKMEILKKFYYDKYVIKELPDSYVELQKRIRRERGYGDINVTDEMRKELLSNVREEQKKSLDMWIDYLTSNDAMYPMWFKYYAFRGMLKLNKFDKEKGEFGRRSKTTTETYIELNREALAKVYDTLSKEIGETDDISEEVKEALEKGESFKKLYEFYLNNTSYTKRSDDTEGIWIKYNQGSDYRPLFQSLQDKNTGWCTAGEATAKTQLSNGDFYVYYTKDEEGEYKDPRIAIRMDGKTKIGEVRGVGDHQNLEEGMIDIAEKKLKEFPDKNNYLKKVNDMRTLTEIDDKVKNNIDLSKGELTFLYEINSEIEGFGYRKDPRIKEIRDKRDVKKDLVYILDIKEENIGTDITDFDRENIIYFYGDLVYLGEKVTSKFNNLKYIVGTADFSRLESAEGLESLQSIGRDADFSSLESAEGLESLQSIGRDADFSSLESAEGLGSLQRVGGYAYFSSLESAEGLGSLQRVGVYAYFSSLESAEGLENLQSIGGSADFSRLESAEGLENLQSIGERAVFSRLESAQGLENLQSIGRGANFSRLESAEGLESLQSIGEDAYFSRLESAEGLESLQSIGRDADFSRLESAEGLENLKTVNSEDATSFKEEINNRRSNNIRM